MIEKISPSKLHEVIADNIKKAEKLHEIDPMNALERIKNMEPKKKYAWRVWDKKYRTYVKIYKPYPPKDPFKSRDYKPKWKQEI